MPDSARFISFEGGEGVGKSTQMRLLSAALDARGIAHITTREPGGTDGAEAIRRLLLEGSADRWGGRAEALLFAAARSDHVEKRIKPALCAGQWVICDRFIDSSRAYQSGGELTDDDILALHRIGSAMLLPDLTLLMNMPVAEAMRRADQRDGVSQDRIGGRKADFHNAVNQRFQQFAADCPNRFEVVAGKGSADQIHDVIIDHLRVRGWLSA